MEFIVYGWGSGVVRKYFFPYHLFLAVSYDVHFFAHWLKRWCGQIQQVHYNEKSFIREYKDWLRDVKHTLQEGREDIWPIFQSNYVNPKTQNFADLISFMRPIKQLLQNDTPKNKRVPVNLVLSTIAIQHIMEFPDEKIEQLEDNKTTQEWGNALEFPSINLNPS